MKYLQQGGDQTYENIGGSSWSITELCSGVLCACLPTLRPLVSKCIPSLSRRLHKSSRGYRDYSHSRPTDVEKDIKHTRNNSDSTDPFHSLGAKPGLRYPGMPSDESQKTSRPSNSRRGPPNRRYEFVALTPWQADAERLSREHDKRGAICPRMAPQVTTEIGPSNSPPPSTGLACPNTAICVKHVVVVEKSDF